MAKNYLKQKPSPVSDETIRRAKALQTLNAHLSEPELSLLAKAVQNPVLRQLALEQLGKYA